MPSRRGVFEDFSSDPSHFVKEDFLPQDRENRGLFHVTTAADKVLAEGLKSRKETGGHGLGGGWNDQAPSKVSLTYDEGHASQIAERMDLAVRAARNELTPREAFDKMLQSSMIADDTPEDVGEALGAPEEVRHSDDWEEFDKWFAEEYPESDKEAAYRVVQELDDALPKIFTEAEYPVRVGFTAPREDLAKIDPDQIQVLKVHARRGAKVEHVSDEAELRFKPEDLRVQKPETAGGEDLSDYSEPEQKVIRAADERFPLAGEKVDGRQVREDVPNWSSIDASLGVHPGAYHVLEGIREVPMDAFTGLGSKSDRVKALAEEIKQSGELNPLIVGIDRDGPYILEGSHRSDALANLGARSFPAVIAIDLTEESGLPKK